MWKGLGEDQKVVVVVVVVAPPRGAPSHESGLHFTDFDETGCNDHKSDTNLGHGVTTPVPRPHPVLMRMCFCLCKYGGNWTTQVAAVRALAWKIRSVEFKNVCCIPR